MTKLLACIDASPYAESVCDHTAWTAKRISADVEVLHILDRREIDPVSRDYSGILGLGEQESMLKEFADHEEHRHRLARQRGQLLVDAAVARLHEAGAANVGSQQRNGTLVETVAVFAQNAKMIVLGRRGESAEHGGNNIGSNLERIARAVHTPLLVVPSTFKPIERVLIAFDGGPTIRSAVDRIVATSFLRGLTCHLLSVGQQDDGVRKQQIEDAAHALATAESTVSTAVLPGDAEHAIVEQIAEVRADLLIMGAFGHSRIRELIIGSTTSTLLRSSPVPVLMYR